MPFPTSPRVIYKKNPLEQVICQLRFPTILRIDSELPVKFQERVRQEYPILREKNEISVRVPPELAQLVQQAPIDLFRSSKQAFDFVSADEQWVVGLTSGFLALTCHKYERWETFREHFLTPFQALIEDYSPTFFSRIGLRYQNVIRRSDLGLEGSKWADLLKPYIAGELASPEHDITTSISEIVSQVVINLPDNLGQVRIQHGLVRDESGEICYLIDSDFFTQERMETGNALVRLDIFNLKNRHLFRWCITDRLHQAMEPQQI